MSVDFPAPLGPATAVTAPLRSADRDAVQDVRAVVGEVEVAGGQDGATVCMPTIAIGNRSQ